MKKYLLLLVLLIVGCVPQTYTFEKGFNDMLWLDKKYNASFYTEALDVENRFSDNLIYYFDWNRTLVSLENIGGMTADLEKMKDKVKGMGETEDTKLVTIMIDTRIKMLESEKLYQEGLKIGTKGDTEDGFKCGDKPYVLALSELFNKSTVIGQEVAKEWDDLLTYHPQTRPFLTKDKRPKFYDSPFWPIRRFSTSNERRINGLCQD